MAPSPMLEASMYNLNASIIRLGAILAQVQERKEMIICCTSRTLNKLEQNYCATKKSVWQWCGESKILGII